MTQHLSSGRRSSAMQTSYAGELGRREGEEGSGGEGGGSYRPPQVRRADPASGGRNRAVLTVAWRQQSHSAITCIWSAHNERPEGNKRQQQVCPPRSLRSFTYATLNAEVGKYKMNAYLACVPRPMPSTMRALLKRIWFHRRRQRFPV